MSEKPFDVVGFIMDFEGGEASDEQIIDGFQHLLDDGTVWTLQGSYGRMAQALLDRGLIHQRGTIGAVLADKQRREAE